MDQPPFKWKSTNRISTNRTLQLGDPAGTIDNSKTHTISIFDLPDIVKLSFDSCIFQTLGQIFQQHRGTGIGNQFHQWYPTLQLPSPKECGTHHTKPIWQETSNAHDSICGQPVCIVSYKRGRKHVMQVFAHKHFYQLPVELEDVGTQELLGFDVDANNRTVTYRQPDQPWKIRDSTSAGSWNLRLSGLRSRAVLISRYSWPPSNRRIQILELVDKYVDKGFSKARCKAVIRDLMSW